MTSLTISNLNERISINIHRVSTESFEKIIKKFSSSPKTYTNQEGHEYRVIDINIEGLELTFFEV